MPLDNSKQKLTVIVLVLILVAGVITGYYFLTKGKSSNLRSTSVPVSKTEDNAPKPTTTVKIGSKEVSKGDFQKVQDGYVYYKNSGETLSLPLTEKEVAVNCTDQSLDDAKELDYTQIKNVLLYTPETIVGKIKENEPIVVFAAWVDGTLRAHTIALKTSGCPQ